MATDDDHWKRFHASIQGLKTIIALVPTPGLVKALELAAADIERTAKEVDTKPSGQEAERERLLERVKELERQQATAMAELRQQREELKTKDTTIAQLRQQLQEQAAAAKAPPVQSAVAAPTNDGRGAGSGWWSYPARSTAPAAGGMEMGSKTVLSVVERLAQVGGGGGRVDPVAAAMAVDGGTPKTQHPVFSDIFRDELKAVQQRVLKDAAVLEERESSFWRKTPLMWAISCKKTAIALWLIEHRGQHDLEAADDVGYTALHYASAAGLLEVMQALVAAGANPAALTRAGWTPLLLASHSGHTDVVAFLLQQPAVTSSIDAISIFQGTLHTALSRASANGHYSIVQLLLDAGADPTVPAGAESPLNQALSRNHHAVAALLRHAIGERERARVGLEGQVEHGGAAMAAAASSASCLSSTRMDVEEDVRLEKRQRPGSDESGEEAEEAAAMGGCDDDGSNSEDEEVEVLAVRAAGLQTGEVQREVAAGPQPGPTARLLEALRVVLRQPLLCGVDKAALRWAMGRQEMLAGRRYGDYDPMWSLLDAAPARRVKSMYIRYPWIRWLALDFAEAFKPATVEGAVTIVVGLFDILDAFPTLRGARSKAEMCTCWRVKAELELWRARAFIHKALITATAGPLLECYYKLLADIVDVSVEALKQSVQEERAVEGWSESLTKAASVKRMEEEAYVRDKSGRFAPSPKVKQALPPDSSVEMAIYREATALGFKYKAPVLLEKLSLAFPGPIPDMETFKATMQLPEVQAMYRAAYEHCENNPKRGTIIKLFEVAGVNPKVVKMQRKKKRLAAAVAAAAQVQAAAALTTIGRQCPPCVAAKRKCPQIRGEYCEWSDMKAQAAASPAPTAAAAAAASSARPSDEASAASASAASAPVPQLDLTAWESQESVKLVCADGSG